MLDADGKYRVLFVCTGNVCRSPMAERLFAARMRDAVGPAADEVVVESAGTHALAGDPMTPEAADCLAGLGVDAAGFVSRQLEPVMIESADLVLTATREHRAAVVTLLPRALRRTLTITEFARLLGPVDLSEISAFRGGVDATLAGLVTAAFANRGLVPVDEPGDDDIADPYRRPMAEYVRVAEELQAAFSTVTGRVADAVSPR